MSPREVKFYVEGAATGQSSKVGKGEARKAFRTLLSGILGATTEVHSIRLCGPRQKAYEYFCDGIRLEPNTFHVLLVDAEEDSQQNSFSDGAVWDYLKRRTGDQWEKPSAAEEHHVFLMVRTMETWLVADPDNLKNFYGQKFQTAALPKRSNLEEATKAQITEGLKKATQNTQKGEYHKTKHAFALLETTDPEKVKALPSGRRLFTELTRALTQP